MPPEHDPPPSVPSDLPPSPSSGQLPGQPPFPEKSPTTSTAPLGCTSPCGPVSRATLADDELTARKKELVVALDKIVEPLDMILGLMRNAWRGGVLLLAFSAVMVGVQVHTTLRMVMVQEQLAEVVAAQKLLQQTTTQVADKQTATEQQLNQQSQITIEPSVTPDGSPTAIVVVKPPPASSALPAIPLPLAAPLPAPPFNVSTPKPGSKAGVAPGRQPHPPASASADTTASPPPAPAAPSPIKFE